MQCGLSDGWHIWSPVLLLQREEKERTTDIKEKHEMTVWTVIGQANRFRVWIFTMRGDARGIDPHFLLRVKQVGEAFHGITRSGRYETPLCL